MSARHMRMVRDSRVRPQSRKLVLLVLASYADEHGGSIFPSVPTIARNCELETRQTQRLIRSLVQDGFLHVVNKSAGGSRHATTTYALAERRIVSTFDDSGLNGEMSTTPVAHDRGVSHDAPTRVDQNANGCHGGRTGVSPMTPKESLKGQGEEHRATEPHGAPRRSVGSSLAPTARRGAKQPAPKATTVADIPALRPRTTAEMASAAEAAAAALPGLMAIRNRIAGGAGG